MFCLGSGFGAIDLLLPALPSSACGHVLQTYTYDAFSGARGYDWQRTATADETLANQWDFIDPEYAQIPNVSAEDRVAMRAADQKLPPGQTAYAISRDPRTGKIDGWLRVVASFSLAGFPLVTFRPPTVSAALPMEKYPGLSVYLNRKYPRRFEAGRLVVDPKHADQRKTVFIELMSATLDQLDRFRFPSGTVMLAECVSDALTRYRELGFREIPLAEIRASDPRLRDFTLPEGRHLLVYPFAEANRHFLAAIEKAASGNEHPASDPREWRARVQRIDRALATLPPQFVKRNGRAQVLKAEAHLALAEWKEAEAAVEALERRSVQEPKIRALRLELEVRRRLDRRTGQDQSGEALRYLRSEAGREHSDLTDETGQIRLPEYYELLVLLESGRFEEARKHFAPIRARIAREWERTREARFGPREKPERPEPESLEAFAVPLLDGLRRTAAQSYPEDTARKLLDIDHALLTPPWGASALVRRYRAKLLETLGRHAEAEAEKQRAAALSD